MISTRIYKYHKKAYDMIRQSRSDVHIEKDKGSLEVTIQILKVVIEARMFHVKHPGFIISCVPLQVELKALCKLKHNRRNQVFKKSDTLRRQGT